MTMDRNARVVTLLLAGVGLAACDTGSTGPESDGPLGIGFGDEQFVLIEAGTFQMGNQQEQSYGQDDERPVHTVTLSRDFYLQKTEVTQAQWEAIAGEPFPHLTWPDCGETCPVESVHWNPVQVFIDRLNQEYPDKNFRLPTEAEWEYACRAGTNTAWYGTNDGTEARALGWFNVEGYVDTDENQPHPVAQKEPNGWGLYDMHGNVWEWVQDRIGGNSLNYYEVSPANDPQGPDAEDIPEWARSHRMMRGGSFNNRPETARCAGRYSSVDWQPPFPGVDFGFRLARDP